MSHCKCTKCKDYVYPFSAKTDRCELCDKLVPYTMGYPPGHICDDCWELLPEQIHVSQICRYMGSKVEKHKNEK